MEMLLEISGIVGGLVALIVLVGYVVGWWKHIRKWFLAQREAKEAKTRYEEAYKAYEQATQEFDYAVIKFNYHTDKIIAVCSAIIAENLSGIQATAAQDRIKRNIEQSEKDAQIEMERHNEQLLRDRKKLEEVNRAVIDMAQSNK
jgi:hypothetical protein